MVPSTFTDKEIKDTHNLILHRVHQNSRFVNGRVLGNPYISYKDILAPLGYVIETEYDGDRAGYLAGHVSRLEFDETGLLLSAVVVSIDGLRPGIGFYDLAEAVGLFNKHGKKADPDGLSEITFWNNQVTDIVKRYGRP